MVEPMLSLWAMLSERDVEAYAAGLVLPAYLAHLSLSPVRFAAQARNSDGREPLVLVYVGEGRVEDQVAVQGRFRLQRLEL